MAIVIYCGTQHGIVTVREQGDGQWAVGERRFLPDWDVAELAVDSQGRLIAATRGDGVWFQTDPSGAGRTGGWAKPNYGQPGPGKVHCLAVDPQDPDTIYAGGEPIGIWVTCLSPLKLSHYDGRNGRGLGWLGSDIGMMIA